MRRRTCTAPSSPLSTKKPWLLPYLANKGGLNLIVSYEAFAVKMLGLLRQESSLARHQRCVGRAGYCRFLSSSPRTPGKMPRTNNHTKTRPSAKPCWRDVDTRACCSVDGNTAVAALRDAYADAAKLFA